MKKNAILLLLFCCRALLGQTISSDKPKDSVNSVLNYYKKIDNVPEVKNGTYRGNPIFRGDTLTADPNAVVYNNRLYLFMTSDFKLAPGMQDSKYEKMHDWYVASTADLTHWTKPKKIMSLDDIPWKTYKAWATTSAYCKKTGKYLFYYSCWNPNGKFAIGISEADSPDGVYTNHKIMIDYNDFGVDWGIDPAVFIDDDGKGYIYLQNYAARLSDDFKSVIPETITSISKEVMPKFSGRTEIYKQEGPFAFKKGNLYYLFFATRDHSWLDYFTSSSPLGPFDYGGVVMETDTKKPGFSGKNNHGSVVQFKGKWYIFYHRHIDASGNRRVCAEELKFDGNKIIPVKRTELGLKKTNKSRKQIHTN